MLEMAPKLRVVFSSKQTLERRLGSHRRETPQNRSAERLSALYYYFQFKEIKTINSYLLVSLTPSDESENQQILLTPCGHFHLQTP